MHIVNFILWSETKIVVFILSSLDVKTAKLTKNKRVLTKSDNETLGLAYFI